MGKPKKTQKKTKLELEEEYVEFLRKRLASENYKSNVTPEEYEKTKKKYERAKLKLKFLREDSEK